MVERGYTEQQVRRLGQRSGTCASSKPGKGRAHAHCRPAVEPRRKSFAQSSALLARARAQVRKAVRNRPARARSRDAGRGGEISSRQAACTNRICIARTTAACATTFCRAIRGHIEGDGIPRPEQGGGQARKASDSGEGKDEFRFALTDEEYLDLYLEDLELPDLANAPDRRCSKRVKWRQTGSRHLVRRRAFPVPRTLRHSMSRRIALKRPKADEIIALRAEIEKLGAKAGSTRTG